MIKLVVLGAGGSRSIKQSLFTCLCIAEEVCGYKRGHVYGVWSQLF